MALLVSDVRSALERLKRDITDVGSSTFIEWCDFINKFLFRKIIGIDPERFIDQSTTYTVTSSPSTQSLPSDFRDITPFGTGFFEIDDSGKDTDQQLPRTGFGSTAKGYYISKGNVIFTGIDDSTQFRLRYIPEITKIDESTDYFTHDTTDTGEEIVPDEYLETLVKALDVLYDQWDEDVPAESFADARFIRVLDDFFGSIKKEPAAYGLTDFSNQY